MALQYTVKEILELSEAKLLNYLWTKKDDDGNFVLDDISDCHRVPRDLKAEYWHRLTYVLIHKQDF